MQLSISQILDYTHASYTVAPANEQRLACGITWDSREVKPGFVYVAFPGERVDGHSFIAQAFSQGAVAALAMHQPPQEALDAAKAAGGAILHVDSTHEAFTQLASAWRSHLQGKVVALTGSMGKTTTKNLVRDVLATQFATVATKANQNNELGVPRTLLEASADTQFTVVEMGMRGLGQLEELCQFVKPDVALITNVGECHMELLGSKDNIARAKAEVLEALQPGGIAVLNAADSYCEKVREWTELDQRGIETLLFDGSGNAQPGACGLTAYATDITLDSEGKPSFTLHLPDGECSCTMALRGAHNVNNACAAAALAWRLGVTPEHIAAGLAGSVAEPGRQEVVVSEAGITVINDAYNANPDSMCASLALLQSMQVSGKRFAVLGDMGELGRFTEEGHRKAGAFATQADVDVLVCVGQLSRSIAAAAREAGMPQSNILETSSRDEALAFLKQQAASGDAVLVKASHSMELDRVAKGLLQ